MSRWKPPVRSASKNPPGGWILQSPWALPGIPVANEGFKLQSGWGVFFVDVGREKIESIAFNRYP